MSLFILRKSLRFIVSAKRNKMLGKIVQVVHNKTEFNKNNLCLQFDRAFSAARAFARLHTVALCRVEIDWSSIDSMTNVQPSLRRKINNKIIYAKFIANHCYMMVLYRHVASIVCRACVPPFSSRHFIKRSYHTWIFCLLLLRRRRRSFRGICTNRNAHSQSFERGKHTLYLIIRTTTTTNK